MDGALGPDFEIETEGDGTGTDDATVAIWTFFMGVTRASADDSEASAPGTTDLEARPAAAFALASVQSQISDYIMTTWMCDSRFNVPASMVNWIAWAEGRVRR